MPLFKKFCWTTILICVFLFGIYYVFFSYAKAKSNYSFSQITEVFNFGFQNIKEIFITLYNAFLDMLCFNWKNSNAYVYITFVGIVGATSIFFLFKFLTYRGFKAFKLAYKRAKANPFYYQDWRDSIKYSTYDNLDDTLPLGAQFIIITVRIAFIYIIILLLPVIMLFYIFLELCGILKGVTGTGRVNDFD